MFEQIYIEKAVREHPRTRDILTRFSSANHIYCQRYTEIFNRKAQNFRLQKKRPALILAEKFKNHVLPTPIEYNIGADHNYYFSHMLNCLYDCRYCFLQGMYRSANYVLYVNYEDFSSAIEAKIKEYSGETIHFFSGYDCDSLAMEPVTGFVEHFLPFFKKYTNAYLELRTKSTQIRSLLEAKSIENCVVAYSLSPQNIVTALEHKTPSLGKRIEALRQLQEKGWLIGLRFDPLIYQDNYQELYRSFFTEVFTRLDMQLIHSVSLGSFRLPKDFFRTVKQLYPEEHLFAASLEENEGMTSYKQDIKYGFLQFCQEIIVKYVPPEKFFPCENFPSSEVI